jgi:hypothetical protein
MPTADGQENSTDSQTEFRSLSSLALGAVITPPDKEGRYELVDALQPAEYVRRVWALENVETGEFEELICDGCPSTVEPVQVEFHGYASGLGEVEN